MRVIVVNDYGCINGGASQVAISSVNALANFDCDVTFVFGVGELDRSIDAAKVRVVDFKLQDLLGYHSKYVAAMHGIWNSLASKKFSLLLDEYDPNKTIIHFHSWTKSLTTSVIRLAIGRGFHVVVTLHDYFSICPNGGLYNFKKQAHCLKQPLSLDCALTNCDSRSFIQKNWRFTRAYVQNYVGLMPSGIKNFITISDYSEYLLRRYIGPSPKYFRVRNPIDVNQKPFMEVNNSKKFTFVGRLSPEKGVSIFAEAAKRAGIEGVCVGDGPLRNKIKALNENLTITGWLSRDDVIKHILDSRALVFPSLWHETQGLVVAEAAALGVPSIVSGACAARDAILDGETGLLFQHGSIESLASTLRSLASDGPFAKSLGRNAYNKYWSAPPTLNKHAGELIDVYKKIMDNI